LKKGDPETGRLFCFVGWVAQAVFTRDTATSPSLLARFVPWGGLQSATGFSRSPANDVKPAPGGLKSAAG
jgi:hypothetical protein